MADLDARGLAAALPDAVEAFLADASPAPGYRHVSVNNYRALCLDGHVLDGQDHLQPLLLCAADGCAADGAVYVPVNDGAEPLVLTSLRQRGYRPAASTLTLRLSDLRSESTAVVPDVPAVASFALWASPRYRASLEAGGGGVWK